VPKALKEGLEAEHYEVAVARVVAKGDRITCYFNGQALIDAHDKTYNDRQSRTMGRRTA